MRISDWSSDVCSSDLLRLLDEATGGMGEGATLPGDVAFKLYDTFGFPYDLTEDALRTQGRSEERRGGKECVSTCRSRWSPYQSKTNNTTYHMHNERHSPTSITENQLTTR